MLSLNKKLEDAIKKNELKGGAEPVSLKRNIYGNEIKKYAEPYLFNGYRHEIRFR